MSDSEAETQQAQQRDAEHSEQSGWSPAQSMVSTQHHNPPWINTQRTDKHSAEGVEGRGGGCEAGWPEGEMGWEDSVDMWVCESVKGRAAEEVIATGLCYSLNTNNVMIFARPPAGYNTGPALPWWLFTMCLVCFDFSVRAKSSCMNYREHIHESFAFWTFL